MLLTLFACVPDVSTKIEDPAEASLAVVGDLTLDDADTFGLWDGQVYLTRMSAMESDDPSEWAPFAVGEVWDAPQSWPVGGGLPGMPEGCFDADTLPVGDPALRDVGATLPLTLGASTLELLREEWDGGFDYWRHFSTDRACDCDVGTALALPDAAGGVVVPEPVVLADGFDAAWAAWQDTGTLDLRWAPGTGEERVSVTLWYEDTGAWRTCVLDDDGAARLALPVEAGALQLTVARDASSAIVHPTYGTVQLTAWDVIYPTLME